METYLTLLYLTLEQEIALKEFFTLKGWKYCKPDLSVMTQRVGPCETPTTHNISTTNLNSINDTQSDGGLEANTSLNFVLKDDHSSQVKIEVPATNTNIIDGVSIKNDDDNDDNAEADVAIAADDDPNDDDYEMSVGVSDDGDNDDDFADVLDVSVPDSETVTDNMTSKTDDDGDFKADDIACGNTRSKSRMPIPKSEWSKTKQCPHCEKLLSLRIYEHHVKSHSKPKKVRTSAFPGVIEYSRSDSFASLQTATPTGRQTWICCEYCGVRYRNRKSLKEHIQYTHEKTAVLYQCDVCGIKKLRKSHLDDHMNLHRDATPYCCQKCGKKYKMKSSYNRHVKVCGSDVKHSCGICGQIYKTLDGVNEHYTHRHVRNGQIECVCGVVFKSRSARLRHRGICEVYQQHQDGKNRSRKHIVITSDSL